MKLEITDVPDEINVVSGLSGSVEIKTDKRTVMEYFLDPIMKGFGGEFEGEIIISFEARCFEYEFRK